MSHLAISEKVARSTQNQAFNALLFLYRHVLDLPDRFGTVEAVRSKRLKRMPTVLSKEEVKLLLKQFDGRPLLMVQ